jgi:hypothetical protein
MTILRLSATTGIEQFLSRYQTWVDHQLFYHKKCHHRVLSDKQGIPCFHYRDIQSINSNRSLIIGIDVMTEGWHSYDFFVRYPKNKKYIFFANGHWDQTKNRLPFTYWVVDTCFFLFEMADTYLSPNRFCFYSNKNYIFENNKPMLFVSTIGNVRKMRTYLVDQLVKKLDYENFILRYSGEDLGRDSGKWDVVSINPGEFDPYIPLQNTYYHNLSQTLPMDMYNQARFNLVVETDIEHSHEFFLTEKTIKCLITGMPFVIVSTPDFLSNLQKLGFSTYHTL